MDRTLMRAASAISRECANRSGVIFVRNINLKILLVFTIYIPGGI